MRQRPAGDVVAIVLDCAGRPVQVRCLCARLIGHAVHGHAATALVLLSHAYWRLGLAAWGGRYAANAIGYDDTAIFAKVSAADACTIKAASGNDSASIDGDCSAGTFNTSFIKPRSTADTG